MTGALRFGPEAAWGADVGVHAGSESCGVLSGLGRTLSDTELFWVEPFTIAETWISPDRVAVNVHVRLLPAHVSAGSGSCQSRFEIGTESPP